FLARTLHAPPLPAATNTRSHGPSLSSGLVPKLPSSQGEVEKSGSEILKITFTGSLGFRSGMTKAEAPLSSSYAHKCPRHRTAMLLPRSPHRILSRRLLSHRPR